MWLFDLDNFYPERWNWLWLSELSYLVSCWLFVSLKDWFLEYLEYKETVSTSIVFLKLLRLSFIPWRSLFMRIRWLFHCYCVLMNEGLRSEQESSFMALVVRRLSLSLVLDLAIDLSCNFSPELIFLLSKEPFWIEIVKSYYFAWFSWSFIVEKLTCLFTLGFFFFCVSWAYEYENWRSFWGFYAEWCVRGISRFRELWLGALNGRP